MNDGAGIRSSHFDKLKALSFIEAHTARGLPNSFRRSEIRIPHFPDPGLHRPTRVVSFRFFPGTPKLTRRWLCLRRTLNARGHFILQSGTCRFQQHAQNCAVSAVVERIFEQVRTLSLSEQQELWKLLADDQSRTLDVGKAGRSRRCLEKAPASRPPSSACPPCAPNWNGASDAHGDFVLSRAHTRPGPAGSIQR